MIGTEKLGLITKNTEEVLVEDDLKTLLSLKNLKLKHYIGFEISGMIHLGTGLMSMMKVKDIMDAGVDCSVFLADWHTWINDKLGGNPEVIKKIAAGYFKEGMKASLQCVGGDTRKLKFVLGSELYSKNDLYWMNVVDISKNTTLARMLRSITILGRKEGEEVDFAKLIYPAMQVADIFIQGVHIAHAGMDQRKAHVIARDVAMKLSFSPLLNHEGRQIKPVALHHPLLLGLGKPLVWPLPKENLRELLASMKMSKSKPDTCIFIHDSPENIRMKLNNAFCLLGEVEFNPVLNWAKHLIFRSEKSKLIIERDKKYGGNVTYASYVQLEKDFKDKKLHPADLKKAVAEHLIVLLEPARKHFAQPKVKKMLLELEELVEKK
jgi:tyrosyl-tRNA synthetase